MPKAAPFTLKRLGPEDLELAGKLTALFAEAFDDPDSYLGRPASADYLQRLLSRPQFIALLAQRDGEAVGALVAYEMEKVERACSEIYIYDLAVAAAHRRKGIASALIAETQRLAAAIGAQAIFVQADGDDPAAISLYKSFAVGEAIQHFEIPVPAS